MDRIIKIEKCSECPFFEHGGGFGNPRYVPVCMNMRKNLPYTTYADRNTLVARVIDEIPGECPLTKFKGE